MFIKIKLIYCVTYFLIFCGSDGLSNEPSSNRCSDSSNLFITPGVLSSGANNRGCLSRFVTDGPAYLSLTVKLADHPERTFYKDISEGTGGCIDFLVPQVSNVEADVIVHVSYPNQKCVWKKKSTLRVIGNQIVFIQPEKTRYKGGDVLRVRILAIRSDFTPRHSPIEELWLESPSPSGDRVRVMEWQNVRTRLGMAQVQYKLDQRPVAGKWTIHAKLADGSQGSADITVGDYQLPPFMLSVKHATKVLRTAERLVWTVCVRYPWGEAVEGILVVHLHSAGTKSFEAVRTVLKLKAPRACHRHAVASKRVGFNGETPDVVIADFSFQEDGTGNWQNTTVISQVVQNEVNLEFKSKQTDALSPGLPNTIQVKGTRYDGKPAIHINIEVCRHARKEPIEIENNNNDVTYKTENSICNDAVTDDRGIAKIIFVIANDDDTNFYGFQAKLNNNSSISSEILYVPVKKASNVQASFGQIVGNTKSIGARIYAPLYLVLNDVEKPVTVHFVLITRLGNIHKWGTTTQCPSTHANFVPTSEGSKCNNTNKESLARVLIPLRVTNQMCPNSYLIAYFLNDGVLISARKSLELSDCFGSQTELSWSKSQVEPGSKTSIQIKTAPSSLCALSAIDVTSKWVQEISTPRDVIMKILNRGMEQHRNMTLFNMFGVCYSDDVPEQANNSEDKTVTWFAEAGSKVFKDTKNNNCDIRTPAALKESSDIIVRNDFSESWLWKLAGVGSNGSMEVTSDAPDSITMFEASAFCISKTGLSISTPAVLQVFRDFFVHADIPKNMRRGDSTVMQLRIFNYLYEPLAIEISVLASPHLSPLSPSFSLCVSPRSSNQKRVLLKARYPGEAIVNVRAKAQSDELCGTAYTGNQSRVSDSIQLFINVEPEGIPEKEERSKFLCAKELQSEVEWKWSQVDVIPGTEVLTVWAVADLIGPLYGDSDSLVQLPRGSGEQNLARMATNLLALTRLEPTTATYAIAKDHVARGYARQLQYQHPSGGFSAFGKIDGTPSTWLTAFSIRYMKKAHKILYSRTPYPSYLLKSEQWLMKQQLENGCFRSEGQVFHQEFKAGLHEDMSNIGMTAYVLTSLIESGSLISPKVISNALSCLRVMDSVKGYGGSRTSRVYTQSLVTYAYIRLKDYEEQTKRQNEVNFLEKISLNGSVAVKSLVLLLKMSKRDGEYVWWETDNLSTSIEATSYAILSLSNCPKELFVSVCEEAAKGAVLWLSTHRNSNGGFVSTQDTLTALEALSIWTFIHPNSATNLTMTATALSSQSINVNSQSKIPKVMRLKMAPELKVQVEGTGCALIQATRSYNTWKPKSHSAISVQTDVLTDGAFHCDHNETFCFCAAVVQVCTVWTRLHPEIALLEVNLPSGYVADANRIYSQMLNTGSLIRRIELSNSNNKVILYLGSHEGKESTLPHHQCYDLHTVGPKVKTRPGYSRVMDYYNPVNNDTQMFTIPEDCPARINNKDNNYIFSDNIYASARNIDGIAINYDYTEDQLPSDNPETPKDIDKTKYKNEEQKYEISVERDNIYVIPDNITKESDSNENHNNESNEYLFDTENEIESENIEMESLINIFMKDKNNFTNINQDTHSNLEPTNKNKTFDIKNTETLIIDSLSEPKTSKELKNTGPNSVEFLGEPNNLNTNKTQEDIVSNTSDHNHLSDFHMIDRATDLEVPEGVNGPVPVTVLPPPGFKQKNGYTGELFDFY